MLKLFITPQVETADRKLYTWLCGLGASPRLGWCDRFGRHSPQSLWPRQRRPRPAPRQLHAPSSHDSISFESTLIPPPWPPKPVPSTPQINPGSLSNPLQHYTGLHTHLFQHQILETDWFLLMLFHPLVPTGRIDRQSYSFSTIAQLMGLDPYSSSLITILVLGFSFGCISFLLRKIPKNWKGSFFQWTQKHPATG